MAKPRAGGAIALLELFDDEPELARLCVVHAVAAGPATLASRGRVLDQLARVINEGGGAARAGRRLPPLVAEGVVGGGLSLIHARLLGRGPVSLVDLVSPLTAIVVLPYLGPAAALRELRRPHSFSVLRAARSAQAPPDPLQGLQMRLTYRTVRVLAAIAAEPGLSNIAVGDRAGIADQGQTSKLLARLARLTLVENTGEGQPEGAANAWRLTLRGREVERASRGEMLGRN